MKGTYKWLYRFGAWVLLAESPLSDNGNFGRDRGKEKAYSEISLEIFSQLATITASGTSQLGDYICFQQPLMDFSVMKAPDCCSNPYRLLADAISRGDEFQHLSMCHVKNYLTLFILIIGFDGIWVWWHLVLVLWETVNSHPLFIFSLTLLIL